MIMRKQLSDEQFDELFKKLMVQASPHDETVEAIADSPSIWWSVQREIAKQRPSAVPTPLALIRRWFPIAIPVTVAAVLILSFSFLNSTKEIVNNLDHNPNSHADAAKPLDILTESALPIVDVAGDEPIVPVRVIESDLRRNTTVAHRKVAKRLVNKTPTLIAATKAEIKTEFIPLAYAVNPESGHIIRLKVPGSMMVKLGLVSSLEKPADLVDAEIIVGDDGLSRAIRFIR